MAKFHFSAFTLTSPGGRFSEIVSDAKVSLPFDPQTESNHPTPLDTKALWDTGASHCAITLGLATRLGLQPIGKTTVHDASGEHEQNVYLFNLILNDEVMFKFIRATECSSTAGKFDLIIGMSIITQGDFSITNVHGQTKMSFRCPSIKHIDYHEELQVLKAKSAKEDMTEEEKRHLKNKAKAERKKHKHRH